MHWGSTLYQKNNWMKLKRQEAKELKRDSTERQASSRDTEREQSQKEK